MTKVLDHGSVRLIETWGSDERIIESARMSTDKGFQGWGHPCRACIRHSLLLPPLDPPCPSCNNTSWVKGDEKLLRYLYTHNHMTPFEMAGAIFEIQAPIFVFREWHRHRTQSYNELSARYTPIPDVNYIPTEDRLLTPNEANKQANSTGQILTWDNARNFRNELGDLYKRAEEHYQQALIDGVPKELARIVIPVGRYSRMRASANLRNWLSFLTLRNDPAAQWEIMQYAQVVEALLEEKFPRTIALFKEKK